jgi:hypothetical protein
MKQLGQLAVLASILVASAPFACADTISLGSFATGTTPASLGFSTSQTAMNFAGYTAFATPPAVASTPTLLSGTGNSYALATNGVWGAPSGSSTWVGFAANAGPGGASPAYGYYQFTTAFTAAGGSGYTGTLDVMGDDTVEVLLNGVVLVPFGALGSDSHCADGGPSCSASDVISLNGTTLLSGTDANTFTFVVEQAGSLGSGDPSGVDFTASLASGIAPEPSSLILFGTGLLASAAMFRRRKTVAVSA